jgi:hypothetical protein
MPIFNPGDHKRKKYQGIVDNLPLTAENYAKAIDSLKSRFVRRVIDRVLCSRAFGASNKQWCGN